MINVEHITKKFDDFTALSDVSFKVKEGCIYGMVGSNGAGKSTLLRILNGIYKPDGGDVTLDGSSVWESPEIKSRFFFVPDEPYFMSGASIERMAAMYGSVYPSFDRARCISLSAKFGLDTKKNINTFSKGMKRQAAVILALSCKPDYYFFDETFDGLDPVMRTHVRNLISEDVIDRSATAILTSHSLRELEDLCDQLALLHKGGLVLDSDVSQLKTSLFKIQTAFRDGYDATRFDGLDIVKFTKQGSVCNLIVRGDRDEVAARIKAMDPVLLDILPLSLDEIFTYEMEALGYVFETA